MEQSSDRLEGTRPVYVVARLAFMGQAVVATLFALPIALVFMDGALRWVGVLYAMVWFVALIPTGFGLLVTLADAMLLFTRRRPVVLPSVFFQMASAAQSDRPRLRRWIHRAVELSWMINPLTNLVATLLEQAVEWRPEIIDALWTEARERVKRERTSPKVYELRFDAEAMAPMMERGRREGWLEETLAAV